MSAMHYTTRPGNAGNEVHINYACPCGCNAGVLYNTEVAFQEIGKCCCGRVLVAGSGARDFLPTVLRADRRYELELGQAELPSGDMVETALAVLVEDER